MGIMLAIPIALAALWPSLDPDPFTVFDAPPFGGWPGLVIVTMVGGALYRIARIARIAGGAMRKH